MAYDPIQLEIYKHLFSAIAEEMGVVLRKSSYSPNIKERRDYSCAIFDSYARMIAQAAHIPVHLGSMPLSVAAAIQTYPELFPGDIIALNDPFRGGTHLPDITLVSPVFLTQTERNPYAYVASRAHHADVGGMTAGSMPVAREIFQEGLIIPPVKLVKAGQIDQELFNLILANVRTPQERSGDLWAQISANRRGAERLLELVRQNGEPVVSQYMQELLQYTSRMTRKLLQQLPDGDYPFTDYLDDDGLGHGPIPITVETQAYRVMKQLLIFANLPHSKKAASMPCMPLRFQPSIMFSAACSVWMSPIMPDALNPSRWLFRQKASSTPPFPAP